MAGFTTKVKLTVKVSHWYCMQVLEVDQHVCSVAFTRQLQLAVGAVPVFVHLPKLTIVCRNLNKSSNRTFNLFQCQILCHRIHGRSD